MHSSEIKRIKKQKTDNKLTADKGGNITIILSARSYNRLLPTKNFHNGEFGGNKLKIYFDLNNLFIRLPSLKSTIPLKNARIV